MRVFVKASSCFESRWDPNQGVVMDGWMDEGEIDGCMFYHLSIYHDGEIHAVQLEQSGLPASLCLLVSLEPKWGLPALHSEVCIPLNVSYSRCQHLSARKKEAKNIWNECLWSSGCSECKGIRVLSRFKIHPVGNPGQMQLNTRGWRSLCKEKLRADKCLKRWLNVICWHLPTVGPRCFKHGRAAIQHIFNQCQGRGEKWLNTVFSKGHRPLFQRLGATAHEPQISQLFLPAAPLAWRKNITNKRKLTPTQIKWTQQLIHPLCRIFV